MVRLSLNITVISLLLWSSLATAQSYYNSSEALHQVDEGEHLFSYNYDWDHTHYKFLMNGNGEFLETNRKHQTLSYEYGLTAQYSFGVEASYLEEDTVLYISTLRMERYNRGFESVGMNWRYQKKWSHSLFHTKLNVKVPVRRSQERETDASTLNTETNGTINHKRANLLLGYEKEVFFTHKLGVSLETTIFKTDGYKKKYLFNGNLDSANRHRGNLQRTLRFFYEVPTLSQLFGGEFFYINDTDTRDLNEGTQARRKFVREHSLNLGAYWRRPFIFKTEVVLKANYGWHQEQGDDKDPLYVYKALSGTTYGGNITLRKYF